VNVKVSPSQGTDTRSIAIQSIMMQDTSYTPPDPDLLTPLLTPVHTHTGVVSNTHDFDTRGRSWTHVSGIPDVAAGAEAVISSGGSRAPYSPYVPRAATSGFLITPPPAVSLEPPASSPAVASFPIPAVAAVPSQVGPADRLWAEPQPISPPAVAPFFEGPTSLPPPPLTSPSSPFPSVAGGMAAGGNPWHAATPVAPCRLSLATARLAVREVIMA